MRFSDVHTALHTEIDLIYHLELIWFSYCTIHTHTSIHKNTFMDSINAVHQFWKIVFDLDNGQTCVFKFISDD